MLGLKFWPTAHKQPLPLSLLSVHPCFSKCANPGEMDWIHFGIPWGDGLGGWESYPYPKG
jgi:hypothetical protein